MTIRKLQQLKAKKGFTLVELIIVIAIIAILAAILIPTMMGYVRKSRITSSDSTAASVQQAVDAAIAANSALAIPTTVAPTYTFDATTINGAVAEPIEGVSTDWVGDYVTYSLTVPTGSTAEFIVTLNAAKTKVDSVIYLPTAGVTYATKDDADSNYVGFWPAEDRPTA